MDIAKIDEALKKAGAEVAPLLAEDEFTQAQLARAKGITSDTAKEIIRKCVDAGVFVEVGRRRILGAHTGAVEAYRVK